MAGLYKQNQVYYVMYYIGGKKHRKSLKTESLQVAKHKVREIENEILKGEENLLPTKTPIGQVVQAYIDHIKNVKSFRSHSKDINNLKRIFGACCPELVEACKKYPIGKSKIIEANCFEYITTAQISN